MRFRVLFYSSVHVLPYDTFHIWNYPHTTNHSKEVSVVFYLINLHLLTFVGILLIMKSFPANLCIYYQVEQPQQTFFPPPHYSSNISQSLYAYLLSREKRWEYY